MGCAEIRELFSEYFDGEVYDDVLVHLQDCPACAAEFAKYCVLFNEVRVLPEPEPPAGFHEKLMMGIRGRGLRRRNRLARFHPFAVAAAASVLLVIIWFSGTVGFHHLEMRRYEPEPHAAFFEAFAPAAPVPMLPFHDAEAPAFGSEFEINLDDRVYRREYADIAREDVYEIRDEDLDPYVMWRTFGHYGDYGEDMYRDDHRLREIIDGHYLTEYEYITAYASGYAIFLPLLFIALLGIWLCAGIIYMKRR